MNDLLKDYQTGINLGGWISQYERNEKIAEHFNTFITEKDIERIASWGMDHIRLPFDYDLLEDDNNPFVYKEEGFQYIDLCLEWCNKYHLNVVLDFHCAAGQNYFPPDIENPLFNDNNYEARFQGVWKAISKRYINLRDNLLFEVLNEAVDPTSYSWNKFYLRTVDVIREIDSTRGIIIGGVDNNSVHSLKELALLEDPNIIYNFHFYEPTLFTHQHAHWIEEMNLYKSDITYPGVFAGLSEFLNSRPDYAKKYGRFIWHENNKNLMLLELQDAFHFIEHTKKPLYCGEFGVIAAAPAVSSINWLNDFIGLLDNKKIGKAFWNYKELDFGIVDIDGNIRNQEIVDVIGKS